MSEYSLEKDHKAIKKQIKEWELGIDKIIGALTVYEAHKEEYCYLSDLIGDLETITQEMMAINI